jgi:NADH:ubiquinone oxidoreductase subunit E
MIAPTKKEREKVGAVLVIGGGIAGIQASLDLAESGQKVYLLETSPAIGGNMARLDKTFPTNDCSMCILSPKLVEARRNLNIEIITYSDLDKVSGHAGNFTATINKHARFIDGNKCTGCALCTQHCPVKYEVHLRPKEEVKIDLDSDQLSKANDILRRHRDTEGSLMPVLKEVNAQFNYLPQNVLRYLAVELDVPLSLLYRIASFYSAFSLTPRGRHIINVCLGTTCYVRGSSKILARLKKQLQIKAGETTEDMRFSLETVRCLGCCSLAPVINVDGETYGKVREKEIPEIIEQYE